MLSSEGLGRSSPLHRSEARRPSRTGEYDSGMESDVSLSFKTRIKNAVSTAASQYKQRLSRDHTSGSDGFEMVDAGSGGCQEYLDIKFLQDHQDIRHDPEENCRRDFLSRYTPTGSPRSSSFQASSTEAIINWNHSPEPKNRAMSVPLEHNTKNYSRNHQLSSPGRTTLHPVEHPITFAGYSMQNNPSSDSLAPPYPPFLKSHHHHHQHPLQANPPNTKTSAQNSPTRIQHSNVTVVETNSRLSPVPSKPGPSSHQTIKRKALPTLGAAAAAATHTPHPNRPNPNSNQEAAAEQHTTHREQHRPSIPNETAISPISPLARPNIYRVESGTSGNNADADASAGAGVNGLNLSLSFGDMLTLQERGMRLSSFESLGRGQRLLVSSPFSASSSGAGTAGVACTAESRGRTRVRGGN